MKEFIFGYILGSTLSYFATDYLVRQEIFFKLTNHIGKNGVNI